MTRNWTNEERYELYLRYCRRLGVEPASFGKWLALTETFLSSVVNRSLAKDEPGYAKIA